MNDAFLSVFIVTKYQSYRLLYKTTRAWGSENHSISHSIRNAQSSSIVLKELRNEDKDKKCWEILPDISLMLGKMQQILCEIHPTIVHFWCCDYCTVLSDFTLRKMETVLPSLKKHVDKFLRSELVYKIKCSHCEVCYAGKTRRHLQAWFHEHLRGGPVKAQLDKCIGGITVDSVDILGSTSKGEIHLLTLEALWVRELKPFF